MCQNLQFGTNWHMNQFETNIKEIISNDIKQFTPLQLHSLREAIQIFSFNLN